MSFSSNAKWFAHVYGDVPLPKGQLLGHIFVGVSSCKELVTQLYTQTLHENKVMVFSFKGIIAELSLAELVVSH